MTTFQLGQTIREDTHCTQLYCRDDTKLLKTQPGAGAIFGTKCDGSSGQKICDKGKCKVPDGDGGGGTTVQGVIDSICEAANTVVNAVITSITNIFG